MPLTITSGVNDSDCHDVELSIGVMCWLCERSGFQSNWSCDFTTLSGRVSLAVHVQSEDATSRAQTLLATENQLKNVRGLEFG